MLSLIFTAITIPFLPFFLCAKMVQEINSTGGNHPIAQEQIVLGETNVKSDLSEISGEIYNHSMFPADFPEKGMTPMRKKDYQDIKIWAGASVVLDVDSGTILEYDNGRKRTQIASLTKLMTALLVIEKMNNLEEEISISPAALKVPGTVVGCPSSGFCNGNRLYDGEKVTARNLLKAILLNSANDAATALAIHISGSEKDFVLEMNKKAKELGLKDTNFCTASGLEIDGREAECYSSAYDIARIATHSLQYATIWEIMKIEEDCFYSADGKYKYDLKNTNIFLSELPDCLGGKTGFTPLAGRSLLLAATDPEKKHRIVAVILNDPERWEDMKKLISWVFNNYEWR